MFTRSNINSENIASLIDNDTNNLFTTCRNILKDKNYITTEKA